MKSFLAILFFNYALLKLLLLVNNLWVGLVGIVLILVVNILWSYNQAYSKYRGEPHGHK